MKIRHSHKTIVLISTIIAVIISFIPMTAAPAFAVTSVKSAKSAYIRAVQKEDAAKSAYNIASRDFNKGSVGFFNWIAKNSTGWQKKDAEKAVSGIANTSFKKYTDVGAKTDATNLTRMKHAVDLLPVLAKDRAKDTNFPNLPEPSIRNAYMARAQINANASAVVGEHMGSDSGFPLVGNECLAWGYTNPFIPWYDEEKESYDKARAAILRKYNVDINDPKAEDEWIDRVSWETYEKNMCAFGEIGHYCNVCCGPISLVNFDTGETTYYMADTVMFGLGEAQYGWICHCLTGDVLTEHEDAYSVDEYTKLFYKYYNSVYPKAEIAAYNNAKKATRTARSELKAAMKMKRPTAKRTGKKVVVKLNRIPGVKYYQISVSPYSGKTKIVKITRSAKNTIKIKKARKQYVKVRAYVRVYGKRIYGKWSYVRIAK